MGSLNIQRGRDLGLMNYNAYRKFCGLEPLESFDNWPGLKFKTLFVLHNFLLITIV